MDTQQISHYRNATTRLRERARSLQQQALGIHNSFASRPGQTLRAEIAHEMLALTEESVELSQLAAQYERRLRQAGVAV